MKKILEKFGGLDFSPYLCHRKRNIIHKDMKKKEIIMEYNGLLSVLRSEVEEYENMTGEEYPRKYKWGFFNEMKPGSCGLTKEDLEWYLEERERDIDLCRCMKREFTENEKVKSSDEGRMFVESLKERKGEIDRMIGDACMRFTDSFNALLKDAGLRGWTVVTGSSRIIPSDVTCFRISDGSRECADIDVTLVTRNSQVTMSLSTAVSGSEDISSRGRQYRRFKAYTMICDNDGLFNGWLSGEYREMTREIARLDLELRKVNEDIARPYGPWMAYKETHEAK